MRIAFRVDASNNIGSGHVMRSLSIADVFKANGHDVVFVMRPQPGDLCDYTHTRGFKVKQLAKPSEWLTPQSATDYNAWLHVSVKSDAEDFLSVAGIFDLVVIDHYGINAHWETIVKSLTSAKLIAIDDLVREHKCDLIIDQTLGRVAAEYHATSSECHVLTGTKYALLKKQFSRLHAFAETKKIDKQHHKILLTMGAIDKPNATLNVLKALSERESAIQTTVLLGNKAPNFDNVSAFCKKHSDWIQHVPFCEDMATLMLDHTIAIGAPGSTSWERACMGLPSILVPLADNQLQICQNLIKEKAAISLSLGEIPTQLNSKLNELLINFESMRLNNLKLCDGKGATRVVEEINRLGWL